MSQAKTNFKEKYTNLENNGKTNQLHITSFPRENWLNITHETANHNFYLFF